jgi:hypothetical protein
LSGVAGALGYKLIATKSLPANWNCPLPAATGFAKCKCLSSTASDGDAAHPDAAHRYVFWNEAE